MALLPLGFVLVKVENLRAERLRRALGIAFFGRFRKLAHANVVLIDHCRSAEGLVDVRHFDGGGLPLDEFGDDAILPGVIVCTR